MQLLRTLRIPFKNRLHLSLNAKALLNPKLLRMHIAPIRTELAILKRRKTLQGSFIHTINQRIENVDRSKLLFGSGDADVFDWFSMNDQSNATANRPHPHTRFDKQSRKFVQLPQVRIGIYNQLCNPSAGTKFNFSVHQRILQPGAPSFCHRLKWKNAACACRSNPAIYAVYMSIGENMMQQRKGTNCSFPLAFSSVL